MAAYLAYRAPATFAAAAAVFRQIALQRPEWRPVSLLDVGAGPGVAAWAAAEIWPSLTALTLIEAEPEMLAAGRELLPDADWVAGDVVHVHGSRPISSSRPTCSASFATRRTPRRTYGGRARTRLP